MVYRCDICDYETTRLLNFQRHTLRKRPCKPKLVYNDATNGVQSVGQKVHSVGQKVHFDGQKVHSVGQKVHFDGQKVHSVGTLRCSKCDKVLSCKRRLKTHEDQCEGFNKLQCQICLRVFATKQSKYNHIKYVKCAPPQHVVHNTVNNNDNSTTINNITNNNNHQQYITNNIRLSFGQENLDDLCNTQGYMKRIEQYVKMLKYALPKSLEDVFFNEEYPNNQTIKKDRKNDNFVSIHVGENKWEKRLAKDTITTTLETLQKYMDKYIEEVELNHRRRRDLKAFGKEMSKLKYWSTHSIEDKLEIDDYEESSEKEMGKECRIVEKILTDKIYELSRKE
mgnify:CR=1 FL=1